jgi:hypothetical protein
MLPMLSLRLALGTLLAADATNLAPAISANKLALVTSPFAPSESLTIGALTLASGNGLDPIACAVGAQEVGLDVNTQQQIITIIPGATTGFRWLSSGSFTAPITVYGIALIDNGAANLWAVALLPNPVIFQAPGFQLDVDPVQIPIVQTPMGP